jgi:hypothetical protein
MWGRRAFMRRAGERFAKTDGLLDKLNTRAVSWQRVAALEARVAELEGAKRNAMSYGGIWRAEDAPHQPGDVVTHNGLLWFCNAATTERLAPLIIGK